MKKHLVLIGLPGAGKSTVGKLVAERLHTAYVDIDSILMRMERTEVEAALEHEPAAVIVPGGGWAAQPGQLDGARARGYFVYLKARAEVAAGRAVPSGTRPVLSGDDPVDQMRSLFKERDPYYAKADATVLTEAKPAEKVADEVVRLAQTSAGW